VHIIEKKGSSLDFYGNLFLQAGETNWTFQANEIGSYSEKNHLWSPAAGMRLGLRSNFSGKLQLDLAIDGILHFDIYSPPREYLGTRGGLTPKLKVYNATAKYLGGTPNKITLGIEAGAFHFRYNPEIKNLGEYLMRSSTVYYLRRDNLLRTEFENEGPLLLGAHLTNDIFGFFHNDLLMYCDGSRFPNTDINFAYYLTGHTRWGLSIGSGLNVDPWAPKKGLYSEIIGTSFWDQDTTIVSNRSYGTGRIKCTAHLCYDIKQLFSSNFSGVFGEHDLEVYGEAAFIGYRYFDGSQVAPITFGVNVPGFKILWDVMSIELEYFKGNAQESFYSNPILGQNTYKDDTLITSDTPWRWSVFGSKSIGSRVKALLLVARDHYNSNPMGSYLDYKGSWHWALKVRYDF
jgi:hypothetical protein